MLGFVPGAVLILAAFGPVPARACNGLETTVRISVEESPVSVATHFSLADIQRMSDRPPQERNHPPLGFYKSTFGYALRIGLRDASPAASGSCPSLTVSGQVLVTDRKIEIASDLRGRPCEFRAAVAHYRRHAAAESLALRRFVAILPGELERHIIHYAAEHSAKARVSGDIPSLRGFVEKDLRHAIGTFSASLRGMQSAVDSPEEVHKLASACDI